MTESQWLAATDPQKMLEFLQTSGKLTERKARLFAVACCRRIWPLLTDERGTRAVEKAEAFADGGVTEEQMPDGRDVAPLTADANGRMLFAYWAAGTVTSNTGPQSDVYGPHREAFLVGGAYVAAVRSADYARRAAVMDMGGDAAVEGAAQADLLRCIFGNPFRHQNALDTSLLNADTVLLARSIYGDRLLPSGKFDPARLAELAEALEDAGCDNQEILAHLREQRKVHVRGCWVLDLLPQKE